MGVRVSPPAENATKIEPQESGITEEIQSSNGKTAYSMSIMEEIQKPAKVKKRHLHPRRKKVSRKRGGQPGNQNAYKHGKYTGVMRTLRADVRAHIRHSRELLNMIPVEMVNGQGPGRPREHW